MEGSEINAKLEVLHHKVLDHELLIDPLPPGRIFYTMIMLAICQWARYV